MFEALLWHDGEVLDLGYDLLEEVANLLDTKLDALSKEAASCEDADGLGIYDRMEYVAGFGFVACQEYVARICGESGKKVALELGPKRGPVSLVQVVDAAANYWKHHSEWGASPSDLARRTISLLSGIGIDLSSSYPVGAVLRHLQGDFPHRFGSIVPGLAAWRDDAVAHLGSGPKRRIE